MKVSNQKCFNRMIDGFQDVITGMVFRYGDDDVENALTFLLQNDALTKLWDDLTSEVE